MKGKFYATLVIISIIAVGLSGCITGDTKEFNIIDDTGREVLIEGIAEKIISMTPANTEILFALGLDDEIVGVTDFCNYPAEALEKEKIGEYSIMNVERIIELEPDVVFAEAGQEEYVDQLEIAGIPVIMFKGVDFDAIMNDIRIMGQIVGKESEAEDMINELEDRIDSVMDKTSSITENKTVFFMLWNDPLMSAGPTTFIDSIITSAGGINIAGNTGTAWPMLDKEWLIDENPDVIILSPHGSSGVTKDQLIANEEYSDINAIVNNNVFELSNSDFIFRPGPRIVDALEEVYDLLYG